MAALELAEAPAAHGWLEHTSVTQTDHNLEKGARSRSEPG